MAVTWQDLSDDELRSRLAGRLYPALAEALIQFRDDEDAASLITDALEGNQGKEARTWR